MGILDGARALARRFADGGAPQISNASPENPSTSLADPASWLVDWANGGAGGSFGPHVSERTSMAVSAVYRCVSILSGIVAGIPLKIYERTKDGRREAPDHPLQPMLSVAPYPGRPMTAFTWRELWQINQLLWGNHYSIKRTDWRGRLVGFEPVMPWDCEVYRLDQKNKYRCVIWDSQFGPVAEGVTQRVEWHDQEDMIHIPGLGFNGVTGLSRIRASARNAVAMAALLEEVDGRTYENSSRPSGLLKLPAKISKEAFDRTKAAFNEANTGRSNAGKVVFVDKDVEFSALQMNPKDLNTIEARRFQVADISRFFGVPLHLLNETEKATSWGSGLSEQTLGLLIYTIDPDLARIEAELNYKLFYGSNFYVEFDRDALMAMDPVKAAEVAQKEIASGVLTINERRRHKNREPVEHGDEPLINSTNVPLSSLFNTGAQPRQDPIQTDPESASKIDES